MRVLDKLRSLNDYLKSLESVELDDSGMVWIEELSHAAMSAVIAVENFNNKTQHFQKRSWIRPFGFGKLKYENKLVVKMDKIYAKIQKHYSTHKIKVAILLIESHHSKQCKNRISPALVMMLMP